MEKVKTDFLAAIKSRTWTGKANQSERVWIAEVSRNENEKC